MKKTILCAIIVSALLVAGCTTNSSGNNTRNPGVPALTSSATGIPVQTAITHGIPENVLPMNAEVALGTANKTFNVSIYEIEIDPPDENGKHTVNIYIGAKNTGIESIRLVWFSKLTDINGNTYGGIGVTHGGSGARTRDVYRNTTEAARDYIVINDKDFATLSKGAVLDVYFMEPKKEGEPLIPDYHVTWMINPGKII
jgi:hypothetical protein